MTQRRQNVLVTGAGQSVGRVMAEKFLAQGDRVHICDLDPALLSATLKANPSLRGTACDVGDPQSVDRLCDEAVQWLGHIDVLVNAVGISGPRAKVEDISVEDWRRCMAANIDAMFFTVRRAVPAMRKNRHGVIINFSSGSTKTQMVNRTPYLASKAAVEGFTKALARELGPDNIRANAILPGMIDNERMRGIVRRVADQEGRTPQEVEADYLKYISMRCKIQPSELADMVLFLASDKACHVTGQMISVDGNSEWEI